MTIDKVTITGADDNVKPTFLTQTSKLYPFVEWGILFSPKRTGTPRYPKPEWVKQLEVLNLNLSAHLCGQYSRDVIELNNFELMDSLDIFQRIQLNYNFRGGMERGMSEFSFVRNVSNVLEWAKRNPKKSIIFQFNISNQPFLSTLHDSLHFGYPKNVHFLYDSSGGRGVEIASIQEPVWGNYTGYSGGIHPENIEKVIGNVLEYHTDVPVWLDMESGVRTEDQLDTIKVGEVLHTCYRQAKIGEQI